ncbi:MAG: FtsW/RodA/SpoVE family cell cycle protein, partial [Acidimicrobiia bacterium]
MTRNVEGLTIIAASVLAAFALSLVNFAQDRNIDAQIALTFLVFLIAFGGLHLAVRAFAPRATPLLIAPIAALTALGFFEIYRLDLALGTDRAALQRWWILIGAGLASLVLALLNRTSIAVLRTYRNITLLISTMLLLLPNLPSDWGFPLRGLEINGSRLWVVLDVGFTSLQFQPAELAKLGLVAYVASYLADHQRALREARRTVGPIHLPEPRQLIPLLLTWGVSVLILISQRDLGASILLFAGFVLLIYAATGTAGYLVAGGILGIIGGVASYLAFD